MFIEEYIICAAIWFKDGKMHVHQPKNISSGLVITGRRHHNCYATMGSLNADPLYKSCEYTQGFLTNYDKFVDRKEAFKIAVLAGQCEGSLDSNSSLISEDIY